MLHVLVQCQSQGTKATSLDQTPAVSLLWMALITSDTSPSLTRMLGEAVMTVATCHADCIGSGFYGKAIHRLTYTHDFLVSLRLWGDQ